MPIEVRFLKGPVNPKPDDLLCGISTELFPVTGDSYLEDFAHLLELSVLQDFNKYTKDNDKTYDHFKVGEKTGS